MPMLDALDDDPLALLTPLQAAQRLQIARSSLFRVLASGDLRSVKIGRCRRIPAGFLADYIRRLDDSDDRPLAQRAMKPASSSQDRT